MAVKLSQIVPNEVHTLIPVAIQDPYTGETIIDNITVYSPTLERVEAFHEDVQGEMEEEEILLALIKCFTDIVTDEKDVEDIANFKKYFSEIFDTLAIELYNILTIVIKQGFKTREMIASMDDEYIEKLSEAGIKEFQIAKEFKDAMKNEIRG